MSAAIVSPIFASSQVDALATGLRRSPAAVRAGGISNNHGDEERTCREHRAITGSPAPVPVRHHLGERSQPALQRNGKPRCRRLGKVLPIDPESHVPLPALRLPSIDQRAVFFYMGPGRGGSAPNPRETIVFDGFVDRLLCAVRLSPRLEGCEVRAPPARAFPCCPAGVAHAVSYHRRAGRRRGIGACCEPRACLARLPDR